MKIQSHCKSQAEFSSYFYGINDAEWFTGFKKLMNLEEGQIAWQRQFDWQFIVYLS